MGKIKTLSRENLERINYDITSKINTGDEALDAKIQEATAAIEEEKEAREAEDTRLAGLIADEKARAEEVEEGLQEMIETEADNRIAGDNELSDRITAEVERATTKEAEIEATHTTDVERLDAKDAELAEAIAAEAQTRADADDSLQTQIDEEVAERKSEDERILAEAKEYTDTETTRAEGKEAELEASIAQEASDREDADSAIEEAYKAADEALYSKVTEEYTEADSTLEENIHNWVDNKKYATTAQLNAAEATHQIDIQRLDRTDEELDENKADRADTYTKKETEELIAEAGGSMPIISKKAPYFYEAEYGTLDYAYARQHIVDPVFGGCTVVKNGNTIGRNYDWKYSETADFVITTPASFGKHAVIGLCGGLPELTAEKVESGEYTSAYKLLPFSMLDGINDAGLYASINVAELKDMPTEGTICNTMIVRHILENCSTVAEAIVACSGMYNHPQLAEAGYETILYLADGNTAVVVDGSEIIATDRLTNFHLAGVTFNADGTVNTPGNNPAASGITGMAQGLERWNAIIGGASMSDLYYTNGYTSKWYSEFISDVNGDDYIVEYAKAREAFFDRQRDGKTWQTVHSCLYDITAKTVAITPQEGTAVIEMSFEEAKDDVKITLNGSEKDVTPTDVNIYAPTSAGTLGQVLQSNGANSAPSWTDMMMAGMPTGMIMPFAGAIAPNGWLKCDGAAVSRTIYKTLYDVIGTTYGAGDGTSTFNLPNLVGRFLEGASSTTSGHSLGASVSAGLPDHNHTFTGTKDIKSSSTTPSMTFTGTKGTTSSNNEHDHGFGTGGGNYNNSQITGNSEGHPKTYENCAFQTRTTKAAAHSHTITPAGTISGGSHTHTITPTGTIDNASKHNSIYGGSTTVQPASVCVNYLIRY